MKGTEFRLGIPTPVPGFMTKYMILIFLILFSFQSSTTNHPEPIAKSDPSAWHKLHCGVRLSIDVIQAIRFPFPPANYFSQLHFPSNSMLLQA